LAERAEGYSGADIENTVKEAVLGALRQDMNTQMVRLLSVPDTVNNYGGKADA
jgi:SpoVK/Ycf46/Vps4 family AAA+-type ATPase